MIQSRTSGFSNAVFLATCVVLTVTFWGLWALINIVFHGSTAMRSEVYLRYNLIVLVGFAIEYLRHRHFQLDLISRDVFRSARLALHQTAYVGGVLMVTLLFFQDLNISRIFLFTFIPVCALVLALANATLPDLLSRCFFTPRHEIKILLVGPSPRIRRLNRWTTRMARYGMRVVGTLSDTTERRSVYRVPVLGASTDLDSVLVEHDINLIVLLEVPDSREHLQKVLGTADQRGVRVITVNTLSEKYQHGLQYLHHYGQDFITVRAEPLQDPLVRSLKRLADICVALPVVALVLPPLALWVALMQRLQSPGPMFFRQWRSGIQNRPFQIIKFRTMTCANTDPSRQASQNDERVYSFGRFLRRTSLDEFPQFLNVLRGEMSLVGPRPHMLEHNEQFEKVLRSYHVRSLVKPGITGLAQIRGYRGEAQTEEAIRSRVECDIEYIEQYSLFLDFYIVLRTAYHVIFPPKSAY